MSDLQCPATVILLDVHAQAPVWLSRFRVAAEFEAGEAAGLLRLVEESADLFRGETFVVRAPFEDTRDALRQRGIPSAPPAVVELDSGGWRLAPDR